MHGFHTEHGGAFLPVAVFAGANVDPTRMVKGFFAVDGDVVGHLFAWFKEVGQFLEVVGVKAVKIGLVGDLTFVVGLVVLDLVDDAVDGVFAAEIPFLNGEGVVDPAVDEHAEHEISGGAETENGAQSRHPVRGDAPLEGYDAECESRGGGGEADDLEDEVKLHEDDADDAEQQAGHSKDFFFSPAAILFVARPSDVFLLHFAKLFGAFSHFIYHKYYCST